MTASEVAQLILAVLHILRPSLMTRWMTIRSTFGSMHRPKGLPVGRNFHLTNRDIAGKLVELELKDQGE